MKIAKGLIQDGIVVGNTYDKYQSKNPLVRLLMGGFHRSLSDLVGMAAPKSIHEVCCGEGYWVLKWNKTIPSRGSDFSSSIIEIARRNAREQSQDPNLFQVKSIYEVHPDQDRADLIVCCEGLEHLERPEEALRALQRVTENWIIVSVPREPIWRLLNLARGKYISDFGNTPGHIQHWTSKSFVRMVHKYFDIVEIRHPLPWTMLLGRKNRKSFL